jgi:hypothetical protein
MSTDETPVGWLPSIDEWFDYVFDSEDGHELDFSPSNSDRELSQEDLEEWNQMNVTEDEDGHADEDSAINNLNNRHHNRDDAWSEAEAQADAVRKVKILCRVETNIRAIGDRRINWNDCARRQSTAHGYNQRRHRSLQASYGKQQCQVGTGHPRREPIFSCRD